MSGENATRSPADGISERFARLRVAVVADALDSFGERHRTLNPAIRATTTDTVIAGVARTLRVVAVDKVPEIPYSVQFAVLETVQTGDVLVTSTPPEVPAAFWGELLTTRAMHRGCAAAIIDGYTRDLAQIRSYGFPLWTRGSHPADSAGRLDAIEARGVITCGGVEVADGDVVVADMDGVVIVPSALAVAVAETAEAKLGVEDRVREDLRAGDDVYDVFSRYGVM